MPRDWCSAERLQQGAAQQLTLNLEHLVKQSWKKTLITLACVAFGALSSPALAQLRLGTQGNKFTVDGAPRFLVFVSYFGALRPTGLQPNLSNMNALWPGHKAALAGHFAYLKSKGVDGIRVFPNWWWSLGNGCAETVADHNAVIRSDGALNVAAGARLLEVLELARQYGLIVDVTWTIEGVVNVNNAPLSPQAYASALGTITQYMRGNYPNVMFDLENEYNNGPYCSGWATTKPLFSGAQMGQLAAYLRGIDPARVITASPTVFVGSPCGLSVPNTAAQYTQYLADAHAGGFNVFAPHDQRCYAGNVPVWPRETQPLVQALRTATGLPIYLQEPDRYTPGSPLTASDFFVAVQGAVNGGAAAWTFHTEGTFKLGARDVALAPVEVEFLDQRLPTLNRAAWP